MTLKEEQWLETWQEFVVRLEQWAKSYPVTIFPHFDIRNTREGTFTRDETISLAASNAANMGRHVLERVINDVRKLDASAPWRRKE